MKKTLLLFTAIIVLGGCSDKKQVLELEKKITELETRLDDCENGAEKKLAKIKIAYDEGKFENVKTLYSELRNRHPESKEFIEATSIYELVLEFEENKRKEEERLAAKEKAEKLKALNKLIKRYDDVSGITWYKQPYFTHYTNSNRTSIYMGDDGSKRWLRLMMSYEGEDWIFFERAFLSYEGNTIEIIFSRYDDKETENSGGSVWEWIDLTVTKDVEIFLREFARSKDAKMRLSGKYTETRKLTNNERQGIIDVLNGYDVLESEKK